MAKIKMITAEIRKATPDIYGTENIALDDKICTAKYFSLTTGWQWFLMELAEDNDDAFGYVKGFENELGYFSISELANAKTRFGIPDVERDLYFTPCKFSEIKDN